jgi:hypothetical protein
MGQNRLKSKMPGFRDLVILLNNELWISGIFYSITHSSKTPGCSSWPGRNRHRRHPT